MAHDSDVGFALEAADGLEAAGDWEATSFAAADEPATADKSHGSLRRYVESERQNKSESGTPVRARSLLHFCPIATPFPGVLGPDDSAFVQERNGSSSDRFGKTSSRPFMSETPPPRLNREFDGVTFEAIVGLVERRRGGIVGVGLRFRLSFFVRGTQSHGAHLTGGG